MSSTNLQTTFAKSRLTRVCGLLSLLMMGVLQTTSAQQTADICLAGDTTVPLAVETSSINLVTQSPLFLVGAFIALLILLFGVVKFRKNTTFLLTIGLLGFAVFTYNHTLEAQLAQGVHCVCHAEDVVTAPPLVGETGVMQGITDHTQCIPEGLYDSSANAPYCNIYDTDGREVMTSERRVIGYFATWRTGKNGLPAFLVSDIPWGKMTHINYAFGHVDVANNYQLSVNTDIPGNSGTDMTWPEYGIEMDDSLPYTGHFNLFSQAKEQYPNVKMLLSVGGWAETGGYWTAEEADGFASDGGFYAMTTNDDGSINWAGIEAFADSSVQFLRDYPFFDGIDIDYEYAASLEDSGNPTDYAFSNPRRPYLNDSYNALMLTLREKLDAAAEQDDKYYQLTVAAPASSYMLRGLEQYGSAKYLDFLNMMSYDLHGSWNAFAGHNAPLYDTGMDAELEAWGVYDMSDEDTEPYMQHGSLNTDWAVKYFQGILPPGRINVGIPYYTRGWQGVEGGDNGLWGVAQYPVREDCPLGTDLEPPEGAEQTDNSWCGNGAVGIDNIWHDLGELGEELGAGANPMWHAKNLEMGIDNQFVMDYVSAHAETGDTDVMQQFTGTYERHYDSVAVAPYLWNAEKKVFLSTEDEESFDTKVQYVIEEELGGIMFWEMSGDYSLPSDFTAEDDVCGDTYFMGSTLTSRGFNDLQNATPYGIVQNGREMPTESANVNVALHSYPLGNDNFPVGPMLGVVATDGSSLAGAVLEFDIPTSAPPDIRVHWSAVDWENQDNNPIIEVVEEGHTGIGNVGGLQGDFHRVRVTLPTTAGDAWEGMMAFYLPFSTISAVTISFDGGNTFLAATNLLMDGTSSSTGGGSTTPPTGGGGTTPDPTPDPDPTPTPPTGGGTAAFSDGFAGGVGDWFINGDIAISGSGGEGCVTISDPGDNAWDAAFGVLERFSVVQGDDYAVSFDAYASEATTINALWSLDEPPWTTYMVESVALTTQSQSFNYTFTMSDDDDPASVFAFQVGGQDANMVCIDNVELTYLSSAPPPPGSNVVSCASVGQSTAGVPTYPSWPSGDHAGTGEFVIHDGYLWKAAWWMGAEPGTEVGWFAYEATTGSKNPYCSIP